MPRVSPEPYSPSEDASLSPQSVHDISPATAPSGGLTKSWTIPPRPKPGRKPATDTPPSKRKAQNREAQRAFRERRAARVGELEDELRQKEKTHEAEKKDLKDQFEQQRIALQQEIATWRVRSENWERVVKEKEADISQLRKQVEQINLSTRWNNNPPFPSPKPTWDHPVSPLGSQRPPILPLPIPSKTDASRMNEPSTPAADCRKCGEGGHCACVEKILCNLPDPAPHQPPSTHHINSEIKQETSDEMEIDFTAKFATAKPHVEPPPEPIVIDDDGPSPGGSITITDGCGFCTDETNCMCIQNAQDNRDYYESRAQEDARSRLPSISKPQPMEPVSSAGGPGSCPSCVMDPERRRFCQALAGVSSDPTARQPSRTQQPAPRATNSRNTSTKFGSIDARMSCSETYDYLRQNLPDFASKRDSVSFIQQLRSRPNDAQQQGSSASPYEVEAASVLSVLSQSNGGSYGDSHETLPRRRQM